MYFKFVLVFVAMVTLLGCSGIAFDSKVTYFEGSVLAEYHGNSQLGSHNYLTVTFYEKGNYEISFFELSCRDREFPADIQVIVKSSPRVRIVENVDPGFGLAIIKDGRKECHKFEN